jgi:hypothetical protein
MRLIGAIGGNLWKDGDFGFRLCRSALVGGQQQAERDEEIQGVSPNP